ncbi:MAG: hypothetical protein A4S14_11120 [Proteobacteria bacterium SG_bin9]|nr:MAG: hypothetical protein A4S14_11120 [Proteobacteria bacterium SG_bin9]
MSIKTKIAALAVAALTVTGGIAASSQPAQAGNNLGLGIAAGVLGAAVVGSAIAAGSPGYYYTDGYGYRRCGWVRQFDAWGNYVGKVRTCNY